MGFGRNTGMQGKPRDIANTRGKGFFDGRKRLQGQYLATLAGASCNAVSDGMPHQGLHMKMHIKVECTAKTLN